MLTSTIPVPKISTSHSVRTSICFLCIWIVTELPMTLASHVYAVVSPVIMLFLADPHFLFLPLGEPTMIVKFVSAEPDK